MKITDIRYPSLSYTHQVVIDDVFVTVAGLPQTQLSMVVGDSLSLQSQLPAEFYAATSPNYVWAIADASIVSLDFKTGSDVKLSALASGTTSLSVTDSVSGRTTTVGINVTVAGGNGSAPNGGGSVNAPAASGGGGGCVAPSHGQQAILPMLMFGLMLFGFRRKRILPVE